MILEDIIISRNGAKFAISCIVGVGIGTPLCLLSTIPIGLLIGIVTFASTAILLGNHEID